MRIALDATYSVDPYPSGVAMYSQEIMRGLAALHQDDEFLHCYRLKQWARRTRPTLPNVRNRLLQSPLPLGRPVIFHALNQRVDKRPAKFVVATFHDLFVMTADYSTPAFRQRFTEQARLAAKHADAIVAVSAFTAGQVCELLGVPRARVRVIPHGVHHLIPFSNEHFSTPSSGGQGKKMILCVGTLQRRKNTLRLVQSFEQLPSDWKLVLAGSTRGYGAVEVLEYIDRSPCRARIQLAGYLDSHALQQLYAKAAIFAFPSLDEGFGMPVLEAMAHGIPVVTSNRSALREVAGSAAVLVDPESTQELVDALQLLIDRPDLRSQLKEQGLLRAQQFKWSDAIESTYRLYCDLAG